MTTDQIADTARPVLAESLANTTLTISEDAVEIKIYGGGMGVASAVRSALPGVPCKSVSALYFHRMTFLAS